MVYPVGNQQKPPSNIEPERTLKRTNGYNHIGVSQLHTADSCQREPVGPFLGEALRNLIQRWLGSCQATATLSSDLF